MELLKAKKLAEELMVEHKLPIVWTLKFNNAIRAFGRCSFKKFEIGLSRKLVELNNEKEVKDTILHEIAHALVGPRNGHNYIWRIKAIEIGCNGERTYKDNVVTPPKKFIGTCPECKREIFRSRRTRISCGKCSKTFDTKYLFNWKLNN